MKYDWAAFVAGGFILLSILGYILNIRILLRSDFDAPYKEEVFSVVGLFMPPLGVVNGYIHIGGK